MANAFTTKLEAVNIILQILDEEPINSINGEIPLEATYALNTIDEYSREIQSRGWDYNTEYQFPLIPNSDEEIILPQSTLEVDIDFLIVGNSGDIKHYIQRGTRLYNRTDRTFTIPRELKATMVSYLDWDDLPEPFRRWIYIRAGRVVSNRAIGDRTADAFTQREELDAETIAKNYDCRTQDATIFDNGISQMIVNRRIRRSGTFNQYG
jgi:hypothetical protein